jgi:hypothetical protein
MQRGSKSAASGPKTSVLQARLLPVLGFFRFVALQTLSTDGFWAARSPVQFFWVCRLWLFLSCPWRIDIVASFERNVTTLHAPWLRPK